MDFEAQAALFFQAYGQADVAALGEFDRVAEQVQQDLAHTHLVATDTDRPGRVIAALEHQLALLRHRLHQALHLVQQVPQIERAQVQLQPPGFDPGQVQGIVDQPQQMPAGLLDGPGVAALHRIQRGRQQQFAHAQHAGHRRADFVAQRGQETALGLRGLLGQLLLVHRQLPLLAAAQPRADRPDQNHQQQRPQQDVAEYRHAAAPPRRQHLHLQLLRRCPRAPGGRGLHLDDIAAGRQPRQGTLAIAPPAPPSPGRNPARGNGTGCPAGWHRTAAAHRSADRGRPVPAAGCR